MQREPIIDHPGRISVPPKSRARAGQRTGQRTGRASRAAGSEPLKKNRHWKFPETQRPRGLADKRSVQFHRDVSFREFALAWLQERHEELKAGELALATWRSYKRTVEGILVPAFKHLRLVEIGIDALRDLRAATIDIPARGNQALDLARRILQEGERLDLRPPNSNPARRLRRHPEMASAHPAPPSTVVAIYEVCDDIRLGELDLCHPMMAAVFQVVAMTGARPSEIRNLQWSNIFFQEGLHGALRLRRHKTVRKSGEKRIVLSGRARRVIDEVPQDDPGCPYVFPSFRNPDKPFRDLSKAWRRVAQYAGFDNLCLRDLRSGLATNVYDQTKKLERVQEMLGHTSIETTRRYVRISAHLVAQDYDELEDSMFSKTKSPKPKGACRQGRPAPQDQPCQAISQSAPAESEQVQTRIVELCEEVRAGELELFHPRLAAMLELIVLTKVRPQEARKLCWDQVDLDDEAFGSLRFGRLQQGAKRIPLCARSRSVLDGLLADELDGPLVFPSHVRPWEPYAAISRPWRRLARRAGVPGLSLKELSRMPRLDAAADGGER